MSAAAQRAAAERALLEAASKLNISDVIDGKSSDGGDDGGESKDPGSFVEIEDVRSVLFADQSEAARTADAKIKEESKGKQVKMVMIEGRERFCCGFIGADKARFCCVRLASGQTTCGVKSHSKKAPIMDYSCYVPYPSSKPSALVTPSVYVPRLPRTISCEDTRTVEEWILIFTRLNAVDDKDDVIATPSKLIAKPEMGATPKVTRTTFLEIDESKEVQTDRDFETDFALTLESLRDRCRVLSGAMVAVRKRSRSALRELEDLYMQTDEAFDNQNQKLTFVTATIGDQPELSEAPTPQVWSSITSIYQNHISMDASLENAHKGASLAVEAVATLKDTFDSERVALVESQNRNTQEFSDIRNLLRLLIPLTGRLNMVESKVEGLEANSGTTTGAVSSSGTRENDISELRAEIQRVRSGMGGQIVHISRKPFHNPDDIDPWVREQVGEDGCPGYWFDIVSMLEAVVDASRTTDATIDLQGRINKAGHESVVEARIVNSFSTTVPAVFNKRKQADFTAIAKFSDWMSDDGMKGLVPTLERNIEIFDTQQMQAIDNRFSGSAPSCSQTFERYYLVLAEAV